MTISSKKNKISETSKKSLLKVKNQVKEVFNRKEVSSLISLKQEYINIFKDKSEKNKINNLLKVLNLSTAYLERLTAIKSDLLLLSNSISKLINKESLYIKEGRSFNSLSKKDQDTQIEINLHVIYEVSEDIDYKLSIIENNISYIDKMQFAVKTCLSTLKSLNGNNYD